MRLDRLLPLPTPLVQPGRKDGNPPRREPDTPERHASSDPEAREGQDSGERPATPPDHIDIKV